MFIYEGVNKKGTRTAKVGGKNIDIPENLKYADYEKISNSQKGLGAGDKIFMNVEGTPPKLIGKLPNLEKPTIEKTLAYFENQITNAKIENAFVITANGEVYHLISQF